MEIVFVLLNIFYQIISAYQKRKDVQMENILMRILEFVNLVLQDAFLAGLIQHVICARLPIILFQLHNFVNVLKDILDPSNPKNVFKTLL